MKTTLVLFTTTFFILSAGADETERDIPSSVELYNTKNTINQALEDHSFNKKMSEIYENLKKNWIDYSKKIKSSASKEFDRYNATAVFGLEGNTIRLLGSSLKQIEINLGKIPISADLYYRIEVKPSFHAGKQLRKDIYVVGLNESSFISAGTQVRLTFYREFDSKFEGLFSELPYFLDKIPKNSSEMNKLSAQEGVRIEILGNLELSKGITQLTNNASISAVLGYDIFKGLFMLDLFKYSQNEVRTRFMGTINRGTVKASASASLLSKFNIFNIIPHWMHDLTDFGIKIGFSKSFNFFQRYPIEAHLVDYFFRFNSLSNDKQLSKPCLHPNDMAISDSNIDSNINDQTDMSARGFTPTAESAFDEIVANVSHGRFISLFNPNIKEEGLSEKLLQGALKAEQLACQDSELPSYKRRVVHFFKGRMASNIFALDFGPKISRLLRTTNSVGNSEVFVSSINNHKEFDYYLLLNSLTKFKNYFLFGRSEKEYSTDIDALFLSDKDKNVIDFSKFYKRIKYQEKFINSSNLNDIYTTIDRSIPKHFQDRDSILNLIPTSEQKNAIISLVYSLSNQVLIDIDRMDKNQLYSQLYSFLDKHPKKYLMNLPESEKGQTSGVSFNNYVDNIYNLLLKISKNAASSEVAEKRARLTKINKGTNDYNTITSELAPIGSEKYYALMELLSNEVFTRYIFNEFFPSIMDQNTASKSMSVKLNIQSDLIPTSEQFIGTDPYSSIYEAVTLLRSIINDDSLDLRLESTTTADGIANVNPVSFHGFNLIPTEPFN